MVQQSVFRHITAIITSRTIQHGVYAARSKIPFDVFTREAASSLHFSQNNSLVHSMSAMTATVPQIIQHLQPLFSFVKRRQLRITSS